MDVDYKIYVNLKSGLEHLVVYPGFLGEPVHITVCGLDMTRGSFFLDETNMSVFWRKQKACKNCKRAAKR